jgi:hypothetical protein
MPRLIVNYPDGSQRDEQYGTGGRYDGPKENIVWCWDRDGIPPVEISLGYMERIEKIEIVKDANGKKQYDLVATGENKTTMRKVPQKQLVVYLRNGSTGKVAQSKKAPKKLPPENP